VTHRTRDSIQLQGWSEPEACPDSEQNLTYYRDIELIPLPISYPCISDSYRRSYPNPMLFEKYRHYHQMHTRIILSSSSPLQSFSPRSCLIEPPHQSFHSLEILNGSWISLIKKEDQLSIFGLIRSLNVIFHCKVNPSIFFRTVLTSSQT
jgi:hypothetical protein